MTKDSGQLWFFVLLIISAVGWWRSLIAEFRLALSSDAHTYILLILPLSITLLYLGKRDAARGPETGRIRAAVLLVVALSLRVLTGWNVWHLSNSDNLAFSVGALVLFWIGSAMICFGSSKFRQNWFAVCFLFALVPLPDHVVAWIRSLLQAQSAWAASTLFRTAGVPIERDGVMLFIPGLNIEVAKECSSIRSSTMVVVTTLLLAHLFLKAWWRKVLLVASAVPFSIAKNAIRIFVITELGTRVDPRFLHGWLHREGGFIFLGGALLSEILFLWILRWNESGAADVPSRTLYAAPQR